MKAEKTQVPNRWLAKLSYSDSDTETVQNQERFETYCAQHQIEIEKKTKITGHMYVYRVLLSNDDQRIFLSQQPFVRSLQKATLCVQD